MKYFPIPAYDEQKHESMMKLTEQSTQLMIEICKNLKIPLQAVHISLWLFHCQVKLMTYHSIDRFIYLCASILVGTKISEHLRNPQDILHQLRILLRKRKNITKLDSEETLKKLMKRIFQAQVNIMINIGFQFDIEMGIQYLNTSLKDEIKDQNILEKVKQTLTSFYRTQLVLYYDFEILALTALDIVMRNEGISIELSGFSEKLLKLLAKEQIREVRSFFINRCSLI